GMSTDQQKYFKSKATGVGLLLAGILLIASNLRAPLTSVGSLIPAIRDSLGVSNTVIGTITTLPLIAFALISPISPKLANRFGMERTILFSMVILAVGIGLRSVTGVSTLFIGTALIGVAISFGNVLLPGLIKLTFPFRIGLLTGLYAVCMNIFGALASGVSVPLSNINMLGWQGALGIWIVLTLVAIGVWMPQAKHPTSLPDYDSGEEKEKVNFWKSPTAWQITVFMGVQSLMFYTLLTWSPDILITKGFSSSDGGWILSVMQFALIPKTFVMPVIAGKMKNLMLLGMLTGLLFILGVPGLLQGRTIAVFISFILWGVACGSAFSLSMMFFTLRTKDAYAASDLSGMAQSIGYLLAAIGPVLFGSLYDLSGGWNMPLFVLLVGGAIILLCGLLAGRDKVID